ncbi:MAG: AAA family ATPase [Planctomycetes bacterium]|nr:AAA family ATPase [Planctomycetota bacterium]
MSAKAHYTVGADVLTDWKDSLFNGTAPRLYRVGTGGLQSVELGPGRVVLVGGLPGGGKTALAMQLVVDALRAEGGLRAVVCNVEMTPGVLLDRQLARLSGVPLDAIRRRQLGAEHAARIDAGLATLDAIADRLAFVQPPYDLGNIAATADDFGGELLILDYLQRIRPPGEHGDRRGSVDALMDYLRQFADAGCAVLAVSAVARSKDRRGRSTYDGDSLSLASFRESSELEYGADWAGVLVPERDPSDVVTLRCLKHRHGEPQDVSLRFERRYQRLTPVDPEPAEPSQRVSLAQLAAVWGRTTPADDDDGGDE